MMALSTLGKITTIIVAVSEQNILDLPAELLNV